MARRNTGFFINNLILNIMEKNEELLERLVNEIAAQNKLIALLIAFQKNAHKRGHFGEEEDYLSIIEEDSLVIYKRSYSDILDNIDSIESETIISDAY